MLVFSFCRHGYDYSSDKLSAFYNLAPKASKKIMYDKINIEKVALDSVASSYLGSISYRNDTMFFVDYRFNWVYLFNKDGKKIKRLLGQGRGPAEIPAGIIQAHVPLLNGGHFFIGVSYDIYQYGNNFSKLYSNRLAWSHEYTTKQEILKNPYPDRMLVYDINNEIYYKPRIFDDNVYLPIYSACPSFNFLSDNYYEYGRIMAQVELKTGKIKKIMGRRSPEYKKQKYLVFDFYSFDISAKSNFYINFPPDSLIYVYDENFKPIKTFGLAGKNMDTKYRKLQNGNNRKELWQSEIENKGYYTWIEYFDGQDLLFRSYTKGKHSQTDGLQIYKSNVLVADVDVPKKFRIEGYIAPYFYSNCFIDEENEKMWVYKFELDL